MRSWQFGLNPRCERVLAAEHAPHGSLGLLERRHGLAEVVERGGLVLVERPRVIPTHLEREFVTLAENASRYFIAFAQPRALLMEGRPARLVFQTRTWDFDADLDKEFSCDAMETYTFYVAAGRVEHRAAACDYIDWTTTGRFQQNLGTI